MGAVALFAVAATAAEVIGGATLLEAAVDLGATDASLGAAGSLAAGEGGAGFLSGMADVAATEGAGVAGTGISSGVADTAGIADAASTVDAAAKAADPLQSIKDTLKSVNSAIDNAVPPGVRQGINVAYQLSKGADPTQVILNSLKSQALSGIGSDIATATGSKDLGQFATGTIGSVLSGQNPMKAIESGAMGVVNSEFNSNLKDVTGLSALPNFNVASYLNPPDQQTRPRGALLGATQPNRMLQSQPLGQPMSQQTSGLQTSMPTLGLPQLGIQSLELPKLELANIGQANQSIANPKPTSPLANTTPEGQQLAQIYGNIGAPQMKDGGLAHYAGGNLVKPYRVPKLSELTQYAQLENALAPVEELVYKNRLVTPQQYEMLAEEPVVYSAKGGEIDTSNIIPELLELLQKHAKPKHYAGQEDSSVKLDGILDLANRLEADDRKKGWKAMEQMTTPQFAKVIQGSMLQPRSNPMAPKVNPLSQMNRGVLAERNPLTAIRATGGLAKYEEAAPKGHHPEFITGVTGYYAGGRGTGQSDDIPAMLHDGDYVMDADAVAALGDGSSKAGNDALMKFMHEVPHKKHSDGQPVPAKIADGEVVLPESFVTALGGGDNKRGAHLLDGMREELREHKRSAPVSKIPPKAKSPLDYLKMAKG